MSQLNGDFSDGTGDKIELAKGDPMTAGEGELSVESRERTEDGGDNSSIL